MGVSGLRSSCERTARNSFLSRSASRNSCSARTRAVMSEMAGGGGAAPSRPSPPAVASKAVQGADEVSFKCPSDGEIQAGADATLKCMSSPALNVATVMLHYRANGGDQYEVLQMTKSGTSG